MAKVAALLMIAFMVCSVLASAARPEPFHADSKHQQAAAPAGEMVVDNDNGEGCGGLNEEECLMRRTLVAHTDYIYSQDHNN